MLAHEMDARLTSAVEERVAALGYDYAAQPKERPEDCNLCGPRVRPVEVARRDRYGFPATFVVCATCGLGYISPRLNADSYQRFYEGVYRPLVSAYHGRRIDAETLQVEQAEYAAGLADFLAPFLVTAPRTIIDVGGSTGVVAGVLAARTGASATVLDPSPQELAVARAAGMETVTGVAENFDPGERRWDLVLLCQTIDHLLDVSQTLAALRRMTSPGGRAFVDVVDLEYMVRRRGAIEGAVKIDHPFYLSRHTAQAFLTLAGYKVVAQRMSDDGHLGFVLSPDERSEPDWAGLEARAGELLDSIWRLRAVSG
ncbi:MAG: class I SAM-dependent methyltransferase [Acidimicrobiales bacterium]